MKRISKKATVTEVFFTAVDPVSLVTEEKSSTFTVSATGELLERYVKKECEENGLFLVEIKSVEQKKIKYSMPVEVYTKLASPIESMGDSRIGRKQVVSRAVKCTSVDFVCYNLEEKKPERLARPIYDFSTDEKTVKYANDNAIFGCGRRVLGIASKMVIESCFTMLLSDFIKNSDSVEICD